MKKVIVVGAGIGGLATSVRLALKGYKAHVFEGNHFPRCYFYFNSTTKEHSTSRNTNSIWK